MTLERRGGIPTPERGSEERGRKQGRRQSFWLNGSKKPGFSQWFRESPVFEFRERIRLKPYASGAGLLVRLAMARRKPIPAIFNTSKIQ